MGVGSLHTIIMMEVVVVSSRSYRFCWSSWSGREPGGGGSDVEDGSRCVLKSNTKAEGGCGAEGASLLGQRTCTFYTLCMYCRREWKRCSCSLKRGSSTSFAALNFLSIPIRLFHLPVSGVPPIPFFHIQCPCLHTKRSRVRTHTLCLPHHICHDDCRHLRRVPRRMTVADLVPHMIRVIANFDVVPLEAEWREVRD
ncbi:hypothetical protein BDQ17DRAFT_519163 [Cyathus striatus]|nr:hypothetical protein BDQ17DRAFT_519163 [Cyathus striatus]